MEPSPTAHPDQPLCARALRALHEVVEVLAGAGGARHREGLHRAALRDRLREDLEGPAPEQLGAVTELQPEAEIGLVRAVAPDRLVPR